MASEVLLIFADPVRPEEFLDLIEELGGMRHPDRWTSGLLSREGRSVWVQVAPRNEVGFDPGDLVGYERKFGAPMLAWVVLSISRTEGGNAVAMEIIEAADRGWRMLIDNNQGDVFFAEEVRGIPAERLPFAGRRL